MPRSTELLRDIHETNLMYLLLLQRMARAGNLPALAGMQISERACQWLAGLRHEDVARLAKSSVVLAQLNLPPHLLLATLSQGMEATLAAEPQAEAPPVRTLA
ncbi:flagellar transcriptional regulator FlhD [Achromobacter sp. SIMBA_011]|jgi:flagellar transcriptional activator FlhD|uniref:Flagellar transcriptional regulator FlhD n=1 Tax=Achromobacter dolens TaxID=1287738 RepID=A0A6S7E286_9BURK|nr:flagellar transcriptional regulator FlhD [Achromobacter dolens]OAS87881.1 transcriptional regulator [Achromobacter xylosoxidans]CAB3816587.1 Flagellar transcriptional regulator FlhD [Achromobacter dolens]CAB3893183.1 Flagellar transcriptional regulator FlhD [Achromobacter dolens]CUJ37389.1 transcriptional activator FlhD [Achromobacter dolens]